MKHKYPYCLKGYLRPIIGSLGSTHEVAEKLNVSGQRIFILHKAGELVPIKSTANGSVYHLQDVLQFMEKKGMFPRHENPTPPKYACETSGTHENVTCAKKHTG